MKSKENNHERAINYLLTGYLPPRPSSPSIRLGRVKEKGPKNGLPPYVAVPNTFPSTAAATWAASRILSSPATPMSPATKSAT